MYKRVFLIIISIFLLTGCSIERLNRNNYNDIIDKILLNNKKIQNSISQGYSYYIPRELKLVMTDENNIILKDKYNNSYFLYADVISYYHKVENTFEEETSSYYSRKIVNKDSKKSGYLEINEINDKFFVEAMYNYAKIEVYATRECLSDVVINVCEVLSSIKYNNKVLRTTIGDKVLDYKEASFNIFTTKKSTTNYLDYIEKYDSGAAGEIKSNSRDELLNDDIVDIEITE